MLRRELTFCCHQGLTITQAKQLCRLAGLFKSPQAYLSNPKTTPPPALATLALIRLASSDPDQAAQLLRTRWQQSLSAEEQHWVWGMIGKVAARRLSDNALDYFAQVKQLTDLNDDSLASYGASRRLDRQGGALFTDRIVRLFSNDCAPLKFARGLGLLGLDLCPAARHFVAKRMIWGARAWP